jgi:hypothetical protein
MLDVVIPVPYEMVTLAVLVAGTALLDITTQGVGLQPEFTAVIVVPEGIVAPLIASPT